MDSIRDGLHSARMKRVRRLLRNLRDSPHPVRFALSRALFHAGVSRWFVMEREGVRYRFWPSSMSLTLFADPGYGAWDREVVRAVVRPGDAVVDVGANVGFVALEAARAAGGSGYVLAYEPHPRILAYLKGNVALNDARRVEVRGAALGSAPGTLRVSDSGSDDQNRIVTSGGLEVPVVRLDDEFPDRRLRLLKIDVEGFEMDVLGGAGDVLRRTAWVYIEVAPEQQARYGRGAEEILSHLERNGFESWTRDRDDAFRRVAAEAPPEGCVNVLAFRRARGSVPAVGERTGLAALVRDAAD